VLDDNQRVVPKGVMGELVVTGDGLARGYTDPALNEGRFIELTLGTRTMRAYRTGDLARVRFDGEIECHGRIDGQIKVRGQRVEVMELETALLRSHSSVAAAAAVGWHPTEGDAQLIAFIAPRRSAATEGPMMQDSSSIIQKVKQRLRTMLPAYMQPSRIIALSKLPTTASGGKLDQKQLLAMVGGSANDIRP
jgi:acyl-coenzyme A synthetase/AMP-(fatty) acid ligase